MQKHLKTIPMAVATTAMWAASMPLIKSAVQHVPPLTLAVLRFGIASVILLSFIVLTVGLTRIKSLRKSTWSLIIIWSIIDIAVPNVLQNIGLMHTTASAGALIQSSYPIFTILLAVVVLSESLGIRKVGGAFFALLGAYLLITSGGLDFSSATFFGNSLLFISAVSYGIADFVGKKTLLRDVNPMLIIGLAIPIGTIILLPAALIVEGPGSMLLAFSSPAWVTILLLGLFPACFAYILYFHAMKAMEVSKLVLFGCLIPIFAIIISYIMLGEKIGAVPLLFGGVIIVGIALAQLEIERSFLNRKNKRSANKNRPL